MTQVLDPHADLLDGGGLPRLQVLRAKVGSVEEIRDNRKYQKLILIKRRCITGNNSEIFIAFSYLDDYLG